MLTDQAIEQAKNATKYSNETPLHQHNDCIRIAYEWLDAQRKIEGFNKDGENWKHLIQKWAGRYVSRSDVEVAAEMHPDIRGSYPSFNISKRLTEPSTDRLKQIHEAFKHDNYRNDHDPQHYTYNE